MLAGLLSSACGLGAVFCGWQVVLAGTCLLACCGVAKQHRSHPSSLPFLIIHSKFSLKDSPGVWPSSDSCSSARFPCCDPWQFLP